MKQLTKYNINTLLFAIAPLILYLLAIVFLLILFIYFSDPVFCQDNETYNLKQTLITETHRHRFQIISFEMLMDTYNLMIERNFSNRDFYAEEEVLRASRVVTDEIRESFSRINQMVATIRQSEPTFRSPIQALEYLRVTR